MISDSGTGFVLRHNRRNCICHPIIRPIGRICQVMAGPPSTPRSAIMHLGPKVIGVEALDSAAMTESLKAKEGLAGWPLSAGILQVPGPKPKKSTMFE